jgi:NAD(P)-dependent dehydrogenase (short-subunit alcohol dehydrogenase family)
MTNAIIVGVGPGLGGALARAFAGPGTTVTVLARRVAALAALCDELRAGGAQPLPLAADVGDEGALRTALATSVDRFGPPDVLVYNAALVRRDRLGELSAREHEQAWSVNVVGAMTAATVIAPLMASRGRGSILLTGGMPVPDPEYVSLSLGKAGGRALNELLAERYEPSGVHVATVTVSGPIVTGTELDPDEVAAHYVRLHDQAPGSWQREVVLP